MLASSPASILNQTAPDLGIPFRFNPNESGSNEQIAWFGRDFEGYVGLWRGPSQRSLAKAPVVRLDTEGQYALVAATVPDYVVIGISQDGFERRRAALVNAGFDVASSPGVIWTALEPFDDPNAYRHKLYNEGRKHRGLEPIWRQAQSRAASGRATASSGLRSAATAQSHATIAAAIISTAPNR